MKLIEALKKIKDLQRKVDDLREKIRDNCAINSLQEPKYGTEHEQRDKIKEWLQGVEDTLEEVLRLRVAIQKTNLNTPVTIELGGKNVVKSIAAWIHRRRDLAEEQRKAWACLTDRGIREGHMQVQGSDNPVAVKIVRFYDPDTRDGKLALYRDEPHVIDATLEVVNAVTDLME